MLKTPSIPSAPERTRGARPEKFAADEFKRLVEVGIRRGLIKPAGAARPIDKTGIDVTALEKVKCQWVDVDPAKARKWLENNFRNRPISEAVVTAYARDMLNGQWAPTHQGIAFNDADQLIDGQHRLHAIVRSGRTIRTMVTFGLPSVIKDREMTTMDCVDRGRTRSVADQLKIQHGLKDGSVIAALAASLASLCAGERTRRLSVGQTLEVYRAFEEPVTWIIANRSRQHGLRATGVLAAFAFAIAANEQQAPLVKNMFTRLVKEDEKLASYTPMAQLRAFLTSEDAKLLTRGADRGLAELVLHAILLEVKGSKVKTLEHNLAGVNHYRGIQKPRVARVAAIFKLPTEK